jgi:hypothetical protein
VSLNRRAGPLRRLWWVPSVPSRRTGPHPGARACVRRRSSRGDVARIRGVTNVVHFKAAEHRVDPQVRDAGEAPSVAGAGPEGSAREIGGDRGARTAH